MAEVRVVPNMGGPIGRARPRSKAGPNGPGFSWSVWKVPPFKPRRRAAQMTVERRAALERYRRSTDQAPWDVSASWPDHDIKPDNV